MLRREIGREFGLLNRVTAGVLGPYLLWTARREARRLAEGKTDEPPTIIERRNWTLPEAMVKNPVESPAPEVPELLAHGD